MSRVKWEMGSFSCTFSFIAVVKQNSSHVLEKEEENEMWTKYEDDALEKTEPAQHVSFPRPPQTTNNVIMSPNEIAPRVNIHKLEENA